MLFLQYRVSTQEKHKTSNSPINLSLMPAEMISHNVDTSAQKRQLPIGSTELIYRACFIYIYLTISVSHK